MLNTVPYLYVNITALCCFVLMLTMFLATRKTPEINAFIFVLFGFTFWTGGSILMRLCIFPGVEFWFKVSIVSLFSLAFLLYNFVLTFARLRGTALKTIWLIGTVIMDILTWFGVFLKSPEVVTHQNGGPVFLYDMTWRIAIPCTFILCIVASILYTFYTLIKSRGIQAPGILEIILGCLIVALGNMAQIIPGNVFPWDTLSGIIFAVLLIFALYRKNMFHMTLLISRSLLFVIPFITFFLSVLYFTAPFKNFIVSKIPIYDNTATAFVAISFTFICVGVFFLLKKFFDTLFVREEQQNRIIKGFSESVSQTLNSDEIIEQLVFVIRNEVHVEKIYVCLLVGGRFYARQNGNNLDFTAFSISVDSPIITQLKEEEPLLLLSDFRLSPIFISMWESEKELLRTLNIACIVALKDGRDIVGIILLSEKEKGAQFSLLDRTFLSTISSIASIAVKNSALYERVYQEARIDILTEVYNYRYFIEKTSEVFDECRGDCLSLAFLDLDDFKLYNQLYGNSEGDNILKLVAQIIVQCVGNAGHVFRYSGKVFAILLPRYDGRMADNLTREIQRRVAGINDVPDRRRLRPVTLSGGICVSPYTASSAKELIENADLAVYNARGMGKGKISIFKTSEPSPKNIAARTMEIISRPDLKGNSSYEAYSSTILALTAAIDAKDHYTYNHSQNVARYSSMLAHAAGLNDDQVRIIYESALLHDIGKISIPESILCKTGPLTDEEFTQMQEHVNNSIEMIRHLPSMDYLIPAAVGHHERWDGRGYPLGLSGDEIPVGARCLAIADAFDAITSDRPYRKGRSVEFAANQIEINIGKQFDPELAKIFVDLVRSNEISLGSNS